MLKTTKNSLKENGYDLSEEAKNATLFTTGNGYMGVRGSLEEFGSTKIQGAFIRGYIDEIIEIVEPFCDNIYMKKYYIDEEKLKHFETQLSCVNLPDFLLVRFKIGDKIFYPWEGEILSWERILDTTRARLVRRVKWKDEEGNITEFTFERFASYSDKHKYFLRAVARPVGHTAPVSVISGIDTAVRTNGQKILKGFRRKKDEKSVEVSFVSGRKYGFIGKIIVNSAFYADGKRCVSRSGESEDLIYNECIFPGASEYEVEKEICLYTQRDVDISEEKFDEYFGEEFSFETEYKKHCRAYGEILKRFDLKIDGDEKSEGLVRFANYHTIISANDMDSVHGISAKGLTGEKYNQFVWWDADIYQMPIFIHVYPEEAKNLLMYRYRMLPDARKNAAEEGRRGARYAFVCSVDGREHVWIYARHPFLQIHINSDVGYGIVNYYENTGDFDFLENFGMEMLFEIGRYWIDRVSYRCGRYEILNVTGTDEHHPYVDNDAYTNYETAFVLKKISDYAEKYSFEKAKKNTGITPEELDKIKEIAQKLYLPCENNGLIPQFDGYFCLSRGLEVEGNGSGTNFQMKQAGLYHKSQIIKQPDVMLLFSYLDVTIDGADYSANWDYYEKMCESSSSLTFPVHAICSARAGRPLSFLNYLEDCAEIDIRDLHRCAHQGVHSGCLAGAWYAVFRGVFGITVNSEGIFVSPKPQPFWNKTSLNFVYKGIRISAELTKTEFVLRSKKKNDIPIYFDGKRFSLGGKLKLSLLS